MILKDNSVYATIHLCVGMKLAGMKLAGMKLADMKLAGIKLESGRRRALSTCGHMAVETRARAEGTA